MQALLGHSDVLPQSKDVHLWLSGDFKSAVGVNVSRCCSLWERPVNHRKRPRLSPYESWDRLQKADGSVVHLTRSEISAEIKTCHFYFLTVNFIFGKSMF